MLTVTDLPFIYICIHIMFMIKLCHSAPLAL
jgi:hypothetical protein